MVEKANSDISALQGTRDTVADPAAHSSFAAPVNSFMSGFGRAVDHVAPSRMDRPMADDPTSDQAFEDFKSYNTNTNLRANQRKFWAGLVDKISMNVMFGAAAAIGTAGLTSAAGLAALPIFLSAVVVSAVTFFAMHQSATREHSDKQMDVSDFHVRREAALIAREIKAELNRPDVAKEASSEPKRMTSMDEEREPTYLIRERSWQKVLAEAPEITSERT
ncbi:MAG: hypothetical protein MRY32_01560 [Rickettsiales bacterium]|nr:hypothetical protein [Rickettsiales bacterium]